MVSKVNLEYGKNGLCLHISHKKSWLDKKKDFSAEKQDLFEKKCEKKSILRKKRFYVTKKQELQKRKNIKTGFI